MICGCDGSGVVLVEGPCDGAPLEAPCECLARHLDAARDKHDTGDDG